MSTVKYILLLFLCLAFNLSAYTQQTNIEVTAQIKPTILSNVLSIEASVSSKTELIKSLRYNFFIYRKHSETNEVIKEERTDRFVLQPNEKKILQKIDISTNTKDKVTVLILIYNEDNKLIARDRQVVLNNDEQASNQIVNRKTVKEEEYTGLRGIVIENTKTKPGRDFYIDFYSNYRLKGINGKEVVKIIEQFSFGVNTIMEVSVGNTIVHRFFLQPKRDFIEQQSKIAILNVTRYFINLERQKSFIRQY